MSAERIQQLRDMIKARTDLKGRPLGGYHNNVKMVRAELARLEAEQSNG